MMSHNIRFEGVIWKIIPKLYLLRLLIWSTVTHNMWDLNEKVPVSMNQTVIQ